MPSVVRTQSRISGIAEFIARRKSPFALARLIMMSGVAIQDYQAGRPDDPGDLAKVQRAARSLLTADEIHELERLSLL